MFIQVCHNWEIFLGHVVRETCQVHSLGSFSLNSSVLSNIIHSIVFTEIGVSQMNKNQTLVDQRPTRMLNLREVRAMTGMSASWIYQKITERQFPAQIRMGTRAVRWKESEIESWLAERTSANQV